MPEEILNFNSYIISAVKEALEKTPGLDGFISETPVILEQPNNLEHGDVSCNIAFLLAKKLKTNPRKIAGDIMTHFQWNSSFVSPDPQLKDTIKGPGFINFSYSSQYIYGGLEKIIKQGKTYGRHIAGRDRVLLEFVSANPTGPMVVVNARAAAIGDAMSRMHEFCGWQVEREYYVNDAGNQIRLLGLSVEARYMELIGMEVSFPEEGYHGQYIYDIAKEIIEANGKTPLDWKPDERVSRFSDIALSINLSKQKEILKKYGISFDNWQSERELHNKGLPGTVKKKFEEKNILYEEEGAVWLKTSLFGDDKDRVLITSKGTSTYLLGDSAYHLHKAERDYDKYITLWGPDHHGYIPSLEAAVKAMDIECSKFINLIIQQVNLVRDGNVVKMSKRAGEFITLQELVEDVGTDAARYFFLMRRLNSHFDFDIDLAKKKSEENPVYYIQYAHARIAGIIRFAREKGIGIDDKTELTMLTKPEENALIKKLIHYPELVENAVATLEPHRIPLYLQEVASLFHSFYQHHRVVGDDPVVSAARMALVQATKTVISSALELLGVSAPERM